LVKVVTGANKARFEPLLESMFRDRKRVFVDRLKWQNVEAVDGVYEKDQFDTDEAVYLIESDPKTGGHLGSCRLLKTTGPHLLKDVFPSLCEGEIPIGDDVWEITRMFGSPDLPQVEQLAVRRRITIGMVEFALLYGATRLTMLSHTEYFSRVLALGWECRPLGLPKELQGQMLGALEISITPTTLQIVRGLFAGGERTPVLELEGLTRAA
jgi:acyl-homoserine lactone synthase